MGMLIHHTWQEQQKNASAKPEVEEELPFTDPEEPMEEKKPVRKTSTTTRRRKVAK